MAAEAALPIGSRAFNARTVDRLRGWLFGVVCSWRWEQDVIGRFEDGDVKICATGARTVRMLHSKRVYPPGGPSTLMKRCSACRRWTPPQAVGSSGVCIDCYYCKLPAEEWVQHPSSHRYTWVVSDSEAVAYLAGKTMRSRRGGSARWGSTRSRRVQFRDDDPRVVGGRIDDDGVLHDPWLGASGPLLQSPVMESSAA